MSTEGLLTDHIHFVQATKGKIFIATDKGIFVYGNDAKRWHGISSGLATLSINALDTLDQGDIIFAATKNGLYKACDQINSYAKELVTKEPTISEIQHAAIQYAEVSPEKIKWMRSAAMNKAWLPDVSLGLDGDVYRTIDLDRGGTTAPDFYIEGPKDKNWGWNVDVSWDLGELIWNSAQTSIDVRSKLMVQLRNDILDQVTKLYFERRRLQSEIANASQDSSNDRALKELRLQELTANIDGLTGGYLSNS